jgi:ATP-dependent protease Clp ATPase subunit
MVTADDVRRLLAAGADAVLVLVEGRVDVVAPAQLDTHPYRGALQINTRDELVRGAGGEQLSEREIKEQAAELDSAVSELGG